ncbi:MAG: hypothetical protein GY842_14215 [bacterium]|nr:hypothetical protein [bacterium]
MGRVTVITVCALVVVVLLAMACVSTVTAPTGSNPNDDPLMAQAYARMTATAAADAQFQADLVVTAIAQKTAAAMTMEANAAHSTAQARTNATATADAGIQATRQTRIQETEIAIEATVIAATLQAGHDQATSTAEAQATSTAMAATATAVIEGPTATVAIADTEAYLTEKEWERRTAPYKHIGITVFWTALGIFFVLACFWLFPRAWIALQMRFLRVDNKADAPRWMLVGTRNFIEAWTGRFQATPYNDDRDRGPGQTIESDRPAGLLPGSDPRVTERDQIVDGLTRPVLAASLSNSRSMKAAGGKSTTPRRRLPAPRWTQVPGTSPGRPYRVLKPGVELPASVRRQMDDTVIAHLDGDWRE